MNIGSLPSSGSLTCSIIKIIFQCATNVSRTYIQASELGLALMLISINVKLMIIVVKKRSAKFQFLIVFAVL